MNSFDIFVIASVTFHFLIYAAYSRLRRDVDLNERRYTWVGTDLDVFAKEYKENRAKVEERLRRLENSE